MKRPHIDILVDGVSQRREAYFEREWIDISTMRGPIPDLSPLRLKPILHDNERLIETLNGYMEIVTQS